MEDNFMNVDYSDTTPNELRYDKNNTVDDITYYPLGNRYLNKYNNELIKLPLIIPNLKYDAEKFNNWLITQRIEYAIKFLQINALKKYVIKNYKTPSFQNPFYYLYHTHYPIENNMEMTKEIIKILIENYDDYYVLITNLPNPKNMKYIKDLLYTFLPNDENNLCSICLSTEPIKTLINACDCKTCTHADCLISLSKHKQLDICSVCLGNYKLNDPVYRKSGLTNKPKLDDKIFFPYNDLYYEPLIGDNILYKFTGMERLTMAIVYLQIDRVRELLQEKEILDQLPEYYLGYDGYKQTPVIALCGGNLYSNCHISYGDNMTKYGCILVMLLETKKIDLNKKDAFNKTALNYVEEKEIKPLKFLLEQFV